MPDLTEHTFYYCLSNEEFLTFVASSNGEKVYTVTFGPEHKNHEKVVNDWACTCEAYKYRDGYCKHIKKVQASRERCGWYQFADGGEPDTSSEGPKCPKCGGPVATHRVAV
jgi:hypothetical protein